MKLTAPKTTEKTTKKLKFNVFNIKSLLVFNRKKLDKVKKEKQRFSLFQKKKEKVKQKEEKIESPRTMGSTLKNIAGALLAKPKSIIDKFKEFFGIILLGILVNNLPRIVKELQKVLGKIKEFFDNNSWIGKTIKFAFDIIAKGMMGILDLTKALMPVIGGSFKFALDAIKTTKDEIGKLIRFFDDLGGGIGALMTSFGYKPPAKAAQAYAKSKGKYYSSTTGKTYGSYKQALKNPQVKKGAQQYANQRAQKAVATPVQPPNTLKGISYNPNSGVTYNPASGMVGYLASKKGAMYTVDPVTKQQYRYGPGEDPSIFKANVQRYQAVKQSQKVQKLSIGGTIRNFFGNMFGGYRRGLGNIPPQEGTGRGGPSDIRLTTKDDGKTYAGPYASPAGTAKGRKARETVNYFKLFENNIDLQNRRLGKEEKNLDLFSEFMKSYENLSALRKKYGDQDLRVPPGPGGTSGLPDEAISVNENEVIGKVGSTGMSTGAHIHLEAMSNNKSIPLSLRKNIFVNGKSLTSNNFPLSSPVGNRLHPILKVQKYHAGEDWPAAANSKITLKGGVKFVKYIPEGSDPRYDGYGNVTVIQDTDGKQYFMGHLNAGPSNLSALLERQKQQLSKKVPGGTNAEKVWNFFKSKKYDGKELSDYAVAGIMGNAQQESGFNPTIAHSMRGNGGKFIGIFQWGNKGNGDRWGNLKKWAKNNGDLDPESIDTQLRFTWVELGGSYGHVLPKLQEAKSPEEAAQIWYNDFEAASHGLSQRQQYSKQFYNKYKGKRAQAPSPVTAPLTKSQQLEKNIITTMINDLGTRSTTIGDKNVSIEKKDGKDVIKVTTGGVFGIGARQLQLDENLLNNLLYEIKNKKTKVDPIKQTPGPPSTPNYGGANASNTIFLNQETAYIVPGPSETVPVPGPTQIVPVFISQSTSGSRSLRSLIS